MMDPFIEKNWKTLAVVFLILLAVFVWPTIYKELKPYHQFPQRQNRLTGKCEFWDGEDWKDEY